MTVDPIVALVLAATGGFDLPTVQPWAGAEIAIHAANTRGVAPVGRLVPGYAFGERSPLAIAEVGLMVVAPEDEATLRVGAVARTMWLVSEARAPVGLGDPTQGAALGLIPGVMLQVEFEFAPEAPLTAGARGGLGSSASTLFCDPVAPDRARCTTWHPGFIGGIYVRKRWASGLALEAVAGPTAHLSIGWAL